MEVKEWDEGKRKKGSDERQDTAMERQTKTISWCHKYLHFYKSLLITNLYSEQKLKQKQEKGNCNR